MMYQALDDSIIRYNTYVTGLETRHVRSQYTAARAGTPCCVVAFNCLWDSIYKNGGLGNEACLY